MVGLRQMGEDTVRVDQIELAVLEGQWWSRFIDDEDALGIVSAATLYPFLHDVTPEHVGLRHEIEQILC